MKKIQKLCIMGIILILLSACTEEENKGIKDKNEIVGYESRIESEAKITTEVRKRQDEDIREEEIKQESDQTVDLDLTQMSKSMVFATIWQSLMIPQEYEGKSIRLTGTYRTLTDDTSGKKYHFVIIEDEAACCEQGIEFVLKENETVYPGEGEEITLEGVFEVYSEEGKENLYSRLKDSRYY